MIYVGIDNGVSGSVGTISDETHEVSWTPMPIKKCLNYTKSKRWINRVDVVKFKELLFNKIKKFLPASFSTNCIVFIERPMVNPGRFQATMSALRCLEATLIVLEEMGLPYVYVDSKQWTKALLPSGLKGSDELKKASLQVAKRLFPSLECVKDGDSILIAEYARAQYVKKV